MIHACHTQEPHVLYTSIFTSVHAITRNRIYLRVQAHTRNHHLLTRKAHFSTHTRIQVSRRVAKMILKDVGVATYNTLSRNSCDITIFEHHYSVVVLKKCTTTTDADLLKKTGNKPVKRPGYVYQIQKHKLPDKAGRV